MDEGYVDECGLWCMLISMVFMGNKFDGMDFGHEVRGISMAHFWMFFGITE